MRDSIARAQALRDSLLNAARTGITAPVYFDYDQANTFGRKMPAYTLVDLKLARRQERHWDFALEVRNLFDKNYFSYGAVDPANPASYTALPAPGRAAYLSVAWRLD